MIARSLTAEYFAEKKFDHPEGGRWSELISGEVVTLEPPPDAHGVAVLNISKALARYLELNPEGYACFELGLIVERSPDCVYCPAISYFVGGTRFAEMDNVVSQSCPALVVEVASTRDRSRFMPYRVEQYFRMGASVVWVADPQQKRVSVSLPEQEPLVLGAGDVIRSGDHWWRTRPSSPFLEEFELAVEQIFLDPDWYGGKPRKKRST